jgi:hypothetical protein
VPAGGDYTAAEVNAALAIVAPDYVPVPSGDPIASALRVIAERLAMGAGVANGGDQIGATFDQLVAKLGYQPSAGDEREAGVKLLLKNYNSGTPTPGQTYLLGANNDTLIGANGDRLIGA